MASKTFLTIPISECKQAAKDVLANSDQKWLSSEKLAEIEDYGGATSMAIISVEELIKALILHLDSQGFQFRKVKGIDVLFNHHQLRYLIAYAVFVMGIFKDELQKIINKIHSDSSYLPTLTKLAEDDKDSMLRKTKFWAFRKWIHLRREFDWFSKVDVFRQDGFYSDYEETIKNPIKMSETDYRAVASRLAIVRTIGQEVITTFHADDEEFKDQFQEIRRNFRGRGYYSEMAKGLEVLRQHKKSTPFDVIKQYLLDLKL